MFGNHNLARSAAFALLAGLASPGPAGAQTVNIQAAMQQPAVQAAVRACTADRDRLCATVAPGGGRIVRCLAANTGQLSPNCLAAMELARDTLVAAGLAFAPPR
jgi:hypothetical protein